MGFSQLFTDVITRTESIIKVDSLVANPIPANNFQKTPSNVNQVFKTINIWNDQIDSEIQSTQLGEKAQIKGYIIKCPAAFIEFIPNEGKQILGGVTQYPDACLYFHLFSDQLNNPNSKGGDYMDMNLEIYDLRDLITSAFLGFHTHNSSAMMSRYDKLDYKHNTITKYLRGFNFCFNDDKGSIFDTKSSRYLNPVTINATLDIERRNIWISGKRYVALVNIVWFAGVLGGAIAGVYLCTTSNQSTEFTATEWALLLLWKSGKTYQITDYIYLQDFCYQCSIENSDLVFNPDNWNLITRI